MKTTMPVFGSSDTFVNDAGVGAATRLSAPAVPVTAEADADIDGRRCVVRWRISIGRRRRIAVRWSDNAA